MKNKYEIRGTTTQVWSTGKNTHLSFEIDTIDLVIIERFTWRIYISKSGYHKVESGIFRQGKKITFTLSRFLLNSPKGKKIDHIDCNPLNNKRNNLRIASDAQNSQNVPKHKSTTTSKHKGVCFHRKKKLWFAYINADKKRYNLGYFRNESDAALAYNNKAKELFLDFAFLNKI